MIKFIIEQQEDCWSFETEEHGLHLGYPDALQATAAAMRAFDPTIPREDVSVSDISNHFAYEKRKEFKVVDKEYYDRHHRDNKGKLFSIEHPEDTKTIEDDDHGEY